MVIHSYDRLKAVAYARRWALGRNPKYADFQNMGGDCTNFASQVLHAGGCPMNYSKNGWYYNSLNDRAPAWTSVELLYRFLTTNKGRGPVAREVNIKDIKIGDLVQLQFGHDKVFDHTPIIIDIKFPKTIDNILIAAHTIDRIDYPLSSYNVVKMRFLHVLGYRR